MKRRGRGPSPATIFFALLSIALGLALYLKSRPEPPAPKPPGPVPARTRTQKPSPPRSRTAPPRTAKSTPSEGAPPGPARAAIVIDDLGNEIASSRRIAAWKEPVAGAVLPGVAFSAACARALTEGGKEVLLHLPMEPDGYPKVRPGPGVILRSQTDAEIVSTLENDLATVPGAVGVNNHMGSAATADARVMRVVAGVLSQRGLFFLDSRTTDHTVAQRSAEEFSVPVVSRRVFLDDVDTEAAVAAQLAELVRRARNEGSAVAIGHPYPATLAVLEREMPRLESQGVRLVRVRDLVN